MDTLKQKLPPIGQLGPFIALVIACVFFGFTADRFFSGPNLSLILLVISVALGAAALLITPREEDPQIVVPLADIYVSAPGLSAPEVERLVATPLERQFSTIAGLDSMSSTNALGATQITLQFNLSRNIDAAAQDVQAAISRASRQLPQNMPAPPGPTYRCSFTTSRTPRPFSPGITKISRMCGRPRAPSLSE